MDNIRKLKTPKKIRSSFFSPFGEYLIGVTNEELYKNDATGRFLKWEKRHYSNHLKINLIECEMVEEFKPFESIFTPEDMRCLALVAHNHLKPAMKAFIEERRELLKKFRLTG